MLRLCDRYLIILQLECLGPDLQALNGLYALGIGLKYCPSKDLLCRCKDPGWMVMMVLCSDGCTTPEEDFCEGIFVAYNFSPILTTID